MTVDRILTGIRDRVDSRAKGRPGLSVLSRRVSAVGGVGSRTAIVLGSLFLFLMGLRVLVASAGAVGSVLDVVNADGPIGLLGFGWLGAAAVLSGSPVAALGLTLLDGGTISEREALGMLSGSRFGASFIVLGVGFLSYLRGHRSPDGLYVGVVALLTTVTIFVPATALALWLVDQDWLRSISGWIPSGWGSGVDALTGSTVRSMDSRLPAAPLFGIGVIVLLAAFWLFDRALPRLEPPSARVESFVRRLQGVKMSFVLGAAITSVTMSVAVSVTMLVPLTLKGVVRREQLIPYVMGANITTFVDTLFAAVLLDHPGAPAVVMAQVVAATVVSAVILVGLYRPYSTAIHWIAHKLMARRSRLALSLGLWAAIPATLILLF